MIVRRIVYSKGGHSMRNSVNLLMKLVSLKINREDGPAPGSTLTVFFFGCWPSSILRKIFLNHNRFTLEIILAKMFSQMSHFYMFIDCVFIDEAIL